MEPPDCPVCGGTGNYLGQLGSLIHFRCRGCGIDFNIPAPEVDDEPEDDEDE